MVKSEDDTNIFDLLHPHLRTVLVKHGIEKPTSIQARAIPWIMKGLDVILSSPTGTGKTEAALLPLFSLMLDLENTGDKPLLVYITPLRALNRDIFRRMITVSEEVGLRGVIRHGDSVRRERSFFISGSFQWFVTTPETFSIMLGHTRLKERLSSIRWVVVDELHELIDNERGSMLVTALERLRRIVKSYQFIGLSATISEPSVYRYFYPCRRDCIIIYDDSVRKLSIQVATDYSALATTERNWEKIVDIILGVLGKARSSIIFTNTRDMAEILGYRLKNRGLREVEVHHGSLSLAVRKKAEKELREGRIKAVIATSSLELGIDIGHIDVVVQYGSPRQVARFYQRIGRSGHRIGGISRGVIVAEPLLDEITESLVIARRTYQQLLEKPIVHKKPLDVLANQIIGMVLGKEANAPREIYKIIVRASPFRELSFEEFARVVGFLVDIGLLYESPGGLLAPRARARRYYYTTTMIPDTKTIPVFTVYGERIGFLDEAFVVSRLERGNRFLLAGKEWEVVDLASDRIIVEEVTERAGLPPSWQGELIPVDWKVAREACSLLSRIYKGESYERLRRDYISLTKDVFILLSKVIGMAREKGFLPPNPNYVLVEGGNGVFVLYTCLGNRGNNALSILIATDLAERTGFRVGYGSDAYRVFIDTGGRLVYDSIVESIERLSRNLYLLEDMLVKGVRRTPLFEYKLLVVARKMGVVSKEAEFEQIKGKLRYLGNTIVGEEAVREILTEKTDLVSVKHLLSRLSSGSSRMVRQEREGFSPFTTNGSYPLRYHAFLSEGLPRNLVVRLMEERIMSKKMALVCIKCGWKKEYVIRELPDRPKCPRCGSLALAPIHPGNVDLLKAVVEGTRKGKFSLRGAKRRLFEEGVKRANLVLSYGKKGVIALTPYGVGVRGATRALSKLKLGWNEFLWHLYLEEKNYFKTRRYWDT